MFFPVIFAARKWVRLDYLQPSWLEAGICSPQPGGRSAARVLLRLLIRYFVKLCGEPQAADGMWRLHFEDRFYPRARLGIA
jgi:hypothetical protein